MPSSLASFGSPAGASTAPSAFATPFGGGGTPFGPPSPRPTAPAPSSFAPPVPPPPPVPQIPAPPAADLETWRTVLGVVRTRRPALASVLEHAVLMSLGEDRIVLGYESSSFLVGQATDAASRELLLGAARQFFGRDTVIDFETVAPRSGGTTLAGLEAIERKQRLELARKAVAEHPLVTAAIEILGAELKDVRLADAEA